MTDFLVGIIEVDEAVAALQKANEEEKEKAKDPTGGRGVGGEISRLLEEEKTQHSGEEKKGLQEELLSAV